MFLYKKISLLVLAFCVANYTCMYKYSAYAAPALEDKHMLANVESDHSYSTTSKLMSLSQCFSGHAAVVITDSKCNPACSSITFGHTSALFGDETGKWFYFYFGPEGNHAVWSPHIDIVEVPEQYTLLKQRGDKPAGTTINPLQDLAQLNYWLHDIKIYVGNYDRSVYIKGNFEKSIQEIKDIQIRVTMWYGYLSYYSGIWRNCMQETLNVLAQGELDSPYQTKLFKWVISYLIEFAIIPNLGQTLLEKYFGNSDFKI